MNISIALATFNGEKYLRELLDSLFSQTLLPKEIVIVDDCSTDKTLEIVEEFRGREIPVSIFVNSCNEGVITSFKKAVSKCNEHYVALCDQDDIWKQTKLEKLSKKLLLIEETSYPSLVICDLDLMDEAGGMKNKSFWTIHNINPSKENFYTSLFNNIATGCTILFNHQMKNHLMIMPVDVIMHDYWLYLIAQSFGKIGYVYEPLVNYRIHDKSVTGKERISFYRRLINNIRSVVRDDGYLVTQFNQASRFKEIYYQVLSLNNKRNLDSFINLRNKSPLYRKLVNGLRYFYK